MKLWEGNVFSCVCLLMGGGSQVTITHDALDPTVQTTSHPTLDMGPHWEGISL